MNKRFDNLYIDLGNMRINMLADPGDPYTCFRQYNGKIIAGDESERKIEIGEVRLAYFSLCEANSNGLSDLSVLDEISMDYVQYYEALYDLDKGEIKQSIIDEIGFNRGDLLIVEELVIFPKFRGSFLGLLALRAIMQKFQSSCGYILLKAMPLQFEANKNKKWLDDMKMDEFSSAVRKATNNLAKYYQKLGFIRIGKSDFYLFCTDFPIPFPDELKIYKD